MQHRSLKRSLLDSCCCTLPRLTRFVGFEAGPQSVRDARANELRNEHRAFQQQAKEICGKGVDAEAYLIQGPTVDTILEQADHLQADLLVLGSHGHGALYRALLGSVCEGVLRRTNIPVLIVPARLEALTET